MRRPIYLLTFAGCLLLLFTLTKGVDAQSSINIVVLHQGDYADQLTRKQIRVITSAGEYAAALSTYTAEAPQPVDFTVGQVLLVDMGPRPSAVFSIQTILLDEQIKGAVRIGVQINKPGRNCATATVITNPYQFVYIPTKREILVAETLNRYECLSPSAKTETASDTCQKNRRLN